MKEYQWNNAELKKKSVFWGWIALGLSLVAIAMFFMGLHPFMILAFVCLAMLCWVYNGRLKSKDRKLKKAK